VAQPDSSDAAPGRLFIWTLAPLAWLLGIALSGVIVVWLAVAALAVLAVRRASGVRDDPLPFHGTRARVVAGFGALATAAYLIAGLREDVGVLVITCLVASIACWLWLALTEDSD
jgi:4-hydroxybenzoate polyprenyltransferase